MRNVLVIEDEKDIAHLVRVHLQDLPRNVELAYDGHAGIAPAERKPFDQGNAGLGLAIARRILELHDSEISVSSGPGHTVFRFTLAYACSDRGAATLSSDARSASTPSRHSTSAATSMSAAPSA